MNATGQSSGEGSADAAAFGNATLEVVVIPVDVSEVFHHSYDHGYEERVDGPDPERSSYRSFATFNDPDGNRWHIQEVTARAPGR